MERLTKIYPSGAWGITGELDDAILRLAAYEETGLEPEDIKQVCTEEAILKLAGQLLGITPDRLRELAEADRERRCAVLPCKIGDTVYSIRHERVPDDEYRMSFHTEMRIIRQKCILLLPSRLLKEDNT